MKGFLLRVFIVSFNKTQENNIYANWTLSLFYEIFKYKREYWREYLDDDKSRLSAVLVREHTKCFGSFLRKVIGEDRRIKQPTKKLAFYCTSQQIQRANVQNSCTNGSLKERDARIVMRFRRLNRFDLFTRISVDGDEYFPD